MAMDAERLAAGGDFALVAGARGVFGATAKESLLLVEALLWKYRISVPWRPIPLWATERVNVVLTDRKI